MFEKNTEAQRHRGFSFYNDSTSQEENSDSIDYEIKPLCLRVSVFSKFPFISFLILATSASHRS